MTEERANYLPMEQQTQQLEQRLQTISSDPTVSYWLKCAVTEFWERDVVDALNDLEALQDLLQEKRRISRLLLK